MLLRSRPLLLSSLLLLHSLCFAATQNSFELADGDRVVFLGDTLIEREQQFGWLELMLTTSFPDRNVTFRNLGWSADTPAGDSRFGLSLLQAGLEPSDEGWKQLLKQLEEVRPTVVFIGYGMASSFDGANGLDKFKTNYIRLLDAIERISPHVRFVLLGPLRHQQKPAPFPAPEEHNQQLKSYAEAVRQIAASRNARFISLFSAFGKSATDNGIHPSSLGYQEIARQIQSQLALTHRSSSSSWMSARAEPLRQAILRKNEWFFYRSRPANMAYIFGFRKGEQGQNAVEIPKFDPLIAAEEHRIAELRSLKPGVNAPDVPRRVGNLKTLHTEQPHPQFEVGEGLAVTLWAENPQLHKPIQMNFDPKGRLWVASSEVYPQIEPGQAATDKIIVLEDTQGIGRADRATVFADGLLIPTGVEPGDGGCYVAQSTELLFFKDTDGDGHADLRRTVLSGFGTEDVHHNLHTLRWGFDGRLYMNQSIYTRTDTETPFGVVRLKGGGIFRFDPRDEHLEILFRGWVNAWGHQFDDFGQSFVTDGAGNAGINYGLPGASYTTAPKARRILDSVSPGSYPKFCSLEIIHSRQFPDDWQGDLITCDFRAHRVVRFKLTEQGAGYVTQAMPDLLRTTADTFRPIDVKLGPDGALYIADWSNPIIQHGEVDFRDPRRDKEHGRIWRITAQGHPLVARTDLTRMKNTALLDNLLSAESYTREQSRRVLVERGTAVRKDLIAWMNHHTDEPAQLQALWLGEALNSGPLDAQTLALATHLLNAHDGRIRAAAVRALANAIATVPNATELLAKLVADDHPRVRLEAIRALGRIPTPRAAEVALTSIARPMDRFLDYALWLTINELAEPWVAAVKSGQWKPDGRENQLQFALQAVEPAFAAEILGSLLGDKPLPRDGSGPWIELIATAGGTRELSQMFEQLVHKGFDEPATLRVLAALNDARRLRDLTPAGDRQRLDTLLASPSEKVRVAALQLIGVWRLAGLTPVLVDIAGSPSLAVDERAAAVSALRAIGGKKVTDGLQGLVKDGRSAAIRREALLALANLDFEAALRELPALLEATKEEADAVEFWRQLLNIKDAGARLAKELPTLHLSPEAARVAAKVAREGDRNPALVQALAPLTGLTLSDKQLSPAELKALADDAMTQGDAVRGERIYRRTDLACMTCHSIGGAGGKVGPDLATIGASAQPDYLVESLLYPNAKIKEGFHSVNISTKDDQELSGILVKETDAEVILRNASNQEISVAKSNITERRNGGSLMPSGLLDPLPPEDRLDLIKFLSMLGKPGDFDATRNNTARLWLFYQVTSQNEPLGIEGIIRGDFKRADWVRVFSFVNGAVPGELCASNTSANEKTRGFFAATQCQSAKGARAVFKLTGEARALWINGTPAKFGPEFSADLPAGTNLLVLQLDGVKPPAVLKLNSDDVSFLTN